MKVPADGSRAAPILPVPEAQRNDLLRWGRERGGIGSPAVEGAAAVFAFRPWVRSTCKKAMLWGLAVVLAVAGALLLLEQGERGAWVRAFGVLFGYSVLFWLTLAKIWWTAGRPAVAVGDDALWYQQDETGGALSS